VTAARQRKVQLILRLVGPVLLVVVLARMDDPGALLASVARADALPLLAALALNLAALHLKVERWRVLLQSRGFRYPLRRAYVAFLASLYLGMVTPGRVGDVVRVQYARHDLDMPYADGLAVSVMDRLCDMYVLLAFVAVGIAHFASVFTGELAYFTWGGVAVIALAPLALLVPGFADKTLAWIYRRVARRQDPLGLERFLVALRAQLRVAILLAAPITVACFLINYTQGWLAARAMHIDIGFFDVMCLLAVTSLLSLLPLSVAGIGVREAFLWLVFPALGLLAEQGVAFGVMVLLVIYVALALAGFVAWQLSPPPVSAGGERPIPPASPPMK
jgi:hypothetical protein